MQLFKYEINPDVVLRCAEVILRTPGLIFIDHGYLWLVDENKTLEDYNTTSIIIRVVLMMVGFGLLTLPFKILVGFYMNLIAALMLWLTHHISEVYIREEYREISSPTESMPAYYFRQMQQTGCIVIYTAIICWCLSIRSKYLQALPMFYMAPVFARLAFLPVEVVETAHNIVSWAMQAVVALYLLILAARGLFFLYETYQLWQVVAQIYGPFQSILVLSSSLVDPAQFVVFWICLFLNQVWLEAFQFTSRPFVVSFNDDWYIFILLVISEICHSPLTLIASCVAVMGFSTIVVQFVVWYLSTCKSHAPPSLTVQSGLTEGIAVFLLAIQTGLTELRMPQRMGAMTVVLFVVTASLFQTLLEVTHPVLLALSTSSRNIWSHVKVLALCFVLFALPCYMNYILLDTVDLDIWTIVVISSSLLTSIQVIGHIVHYALYLYDSHRLEPLESLDDIVYYVKASIHGLELLSALFVVGAGIKDGWSGDWSLLHSVVLSIHCYFNVYLRIKRGWRSFILRQSAVSKIEQLRNATEGQLAALNDVCSICYSEMVSSAKVTPCGHYFHAGCLKKWLYVQDNCPMCSTKVMEDKKEEEEIVTDAEDLDMGDNFQEAEGVANQGHPHQD